MKLSSPIPESGAWIPGMQEFCSNPQDESIGEILIDSGKLSIENTERIRSLQREQGLRFGEAGMQLGILSEDDLHYALARQFGYPVLFEGDGQVSPELKAAYQPFGMQAEKLRALRTQLKLRWFNGAPGRRMLSVVSPGRSEGRSYIAANLAVEFSQLGERTLLIDADLRSPRQHALFKLSNAVGLSSVLSGRADGSALQRIQALPDLALLPAGPIPPNPQELLGRPAFGRFLDQAVREFDVILIDTPASAHYAEAYSLAARGAAALLVVRKDQTLLGDAQRLVGGLSQHGVCVVGCVLNTY